MAEFSDQNDHVTRENDHAMSGKSGREGVRRERLRARWEAAGGLASGLFRHRGFRIIVPRQVHWEVVETRRRRGGAQILTGDFLQQFLAIDSD